MTLERKYVPLPSTGDIFIAFDNTDIIPPIGPSIIIENIRRKPIAIVCDEAVEKFKNFIKTGLFGRYLGEDYNNIAHLYLNTPTYAIFSQGNRLHLMPRELISFRMPMQ